MKKIAVIDRNISLGYGGVLGGELASILSSQALVQNYMAGIGGGDVRPQHLRDIIVELQGRDTPGEPQIMEGLL